MAKKLTEKYLEKRIKEYCEANMIWLPAGTNPLTVIRSYTRKREIVSLRRLVAIILRDDGQWTYSRIGRFLKRDHTSIRNLILNKPVDNL